MPAVTRDAIRRTAAVSALLLALLAGLSPLATGDGGGEKKGPVPLADPHLLHGPWDGGSAHRESVLFVQAKAGGRPAAKLLFDAERVLAVRDANGKRAYESGKDFLLSADGSTLTLPPGSRVPFRMEAELYPAKGSPHSIGHRRGEPGTSLLFGEGHFFHDQQVEVSYAPRKGAKWAGYRPAFAVKLLPKTIERLRKKVPLTVAVSGDSISQGYNASGFTKAPPFMPPYPELVARQLERSYGARVTLHNRAVAGWTSRRGLAELGGLLATKPDLVIIAYGMNDVGGRDPAGFKATVAEMLRRVKKGRPEAEVVLVAPMLGNPEWAATPAEMFPRYRDALASLSGPGVALADLTAVWQELLKRKRFLDMTGNGVNHPNDWGHRLYAQAVLALLVDPALKKGAAGAGPAP
jgi:lysophospholipase L1-like esterase